MSEDMVEMRDVTVAEVYLEILSKRGIDYFFANPGTDFASLVDAFGGYGERAESSDQVAPALERALYAVKDEKRQALLNMMICKHP